MGETGNQWYLDKFVLRGETGVCPHPHCHFLPLTLPLFLHFSKTCPEADTTKLEVLTFIQLPSATTNLHPMHSYSCRQPDTTKLDAVQDLWHGTIPPVLQKSKVSAGTMNQIFLVRTSDINLRQSRYRGIEWRHPHSLSPREFTAPILTQEGTQKKEGNEQERFTNNRIFITHSPLYRDIYVFRSSNSTGGLCLRENLQHWSWHGKKDRRSKGMSRRDLPIIESLLFTYQCTWIFTYLEQAIARTTPVFLCTSNIYIKEFQSYNRDLHHWFIKQHWHNTGLAWPHNFRFSKQ